MEGKEDSKEKIIQNYLVIRKRCLTKKKLHS